jgi:hypothetical protein
VTVIAIDWSGAKSRRAQAEGICVASKRDGHDVELSGGRTRDETVELVIDCEPPVLVGFDFSFGVPAWFAATLGCDDVDGLWSLAGRDGDTWLAPVPPFWRTRCDLAPDRRFRRCEQRLRTEGYPAKSIFQLVGNGQVGAGSVRGMPFLGRLRTAGFAIWPFEAAGERTAFEIYPSRLRAALPDEPATFESPHARDAWASAIVMWEHRDEMKALGAATDPVIRIEGDVWTPGA